MDTFSNVNVNAPCLYENCRSLSQNNIIYCIVIKVMKNDSAECTAECAQYGLIEWFVYLSPLNYRIKYFFRSKLFVYIFKLNLLLLLNAGTPCQETWPGISSSDEFRNYNFPKYKPQPLINHAPRYFVFY